MEYVPIPLARIFQYASAAPRVSPPEACALISAVHALRSATTPLARIRSNASFALSTSPDRAHAVSTAVQVRIVGTHVCKFLNDCFANTKTGTGYDCSFSR